MDRSELKKKLAQKINTKRLGRTSQTSREQKITDLYKLLEKTKNKEERKNIKERIALLEDITDREITNVNFE
jgi:hypothetical protein